MRLRPPTLCPRDPLRGIALIVVLLALVLFALSVFMERWTPLTSQSGRAAFGLVLVNLLGGVLASAAYAVLSLRPSLLSIFLIVLVVTLLLGGRAAARSKDAPMFAGALTIFLILFGLGVSPLPGSAAESFATRIVYVGAALIYALLLAAILWLRTENPKRMKAG